MAATSLILDPPMQG